MDYFNEKFGRSDGATESVPDYMPKSGLLYYDDLSRKRSMAMTGQQYSERTPGDGGTPNDSELQYTVIGGRRCLYKENQYNHLEFDFPVGSTQWTWGCWVYDVLGTCKKQYVMAQETDIGDGIYLSFRNVGEGERSLISSRHYTRNTGKTKYVWAANCYEQGAWHFLYSWQAAQYWGIRFDDRDNGNNLGAERHQPQSIVKIRLLPTQAYGIAIRGAFVYGMVLSHEECLAIYNGSKDET